MALTAKGIATRERILTATAAYLRGDGGGEVTLDDIRAASRTSKSQLFHYFPGGKDELLLEAVRRESDQVIADQQPHLDELSDRAGWERWSAAVVARYRAQGAHCPLGTLLARASSPGAAEVIRTLLADWRDRLARGIRSMQAAGQARRDLDAEIVAASVIAGIQGGVQVLRASGDTAVLEATLALHLDYLAV